MPRYVVQDHPNHPGKCRVFDTYAKKIIPVLGSGYSTEDDFRNRQSAERFVDDHNRAYTLLHPVMQMAATG